MSIFPSYIALSSLFVVLAAAPLLSHSATGSVTYVLAADMDGNPGGECWPVEFLDDMGVSLACCTSP